MPALSEVKQTLPASWYYDPAHYRRELEAIWYRDWICVGRDEALKEPGDYFVAQLGDQSVIVTRAADGALRAFHNTCRHRGSQLCRDISGRFRNGRIVCPYHTWTYSTAGELLATPGRLESDGFRLEDYGLYEVQVDSWRGFIHISLADKPASDLATQLGKQADLVANWPLETLTTLHREVQSVACNWKIFWENYSECYHCPRIHPELCRVMPVYAQWVFDDADLPGWEPAFEGDTGRGRVAAGMRTWTMDGMSPLPDMEGLSESQKMAGVEFASFNASMYIAAHPDYIRTVRIVPTGPESIDLVVEWLVPATTEIGSDDRINAILGLAQTVLKQDAEVCELNQRGLKSRKHHEGVLVAQEYELWEFHEWVRERLASKHD